MIIPLDGDMSLSTSQIEVVNHFKSGYFRAATEYECIQALRSMSLAQIRRDPSGYQELAIAIARRTVCVGEAADSITKNTGTR